MKKITALIALTIFTIKVSCAQTSDNYGVVATQVQNIVGAGVKFEPIEIFTSSQIAHTAEGQYLQLKVDEAKLRHLLLSKKELIELIVPSFDGSNMHLLLYQHEKTAENFESILIKGDVRERAAAPLFTLYQGIIKGDMNSLVAITVLEDEINGVISSREGNINLGKNAIDKSSYVLYNDKQLHLPLNFKCGNSTDSIISYTSEQLSGNKLMSLSYCQKIEFTCDYDMYLHFGSNAGAVINYVISLFNVVGTLYNNEGINMFVKPIVTYTTPDTYCSTSSSCALTSFKLNGFLAGANIYHLLSRDVNGNGGRADLGSLTCAAAAYSNIDGSFNAFPSYSWDANVVAHEMGHNLNSQHTHECAWNGNATAIDNCNIYWGSATLLGPLQNNCSGASTFL
ncbi:MAG: hypothetical protein IPO27_16190 [Bacteroidetes bacterium]|nr:hypothetical protein [Bacteroidota bacterium]